MTHIPIHIHLYHSLRAHTHIDRDMSLLNKKWKHVWKLNHKKHKYIIIYTYKYS